MRDVVSVVVTVVIVYTVTSLPLTNLLEYLAYSPFAFTMDSFFVLMDLLQHTPLLGFGPLMQILHCCHYPKCLTQPPRVGPWCLSKNSVGKILKKWPK